MDTEKPNDRDDEAELDAALEALEAYRPKEGAVDPETDALVKRPDFQEAIAEHKRLAEWEPPPAPAPIELAPDSKSLLVQAEAAAMYLGTVEVTQTKAPRLPTGPVKIDAEIDPRKRPTQRIERKVPPQATRTTAAEHDAKATPKASSARGDGIRGERGKRRGLLVGATIFVAGGIAVLALVRPPERGGEQAASASATQPAPVASLRPIGIAAGATASSAAGPEALGPVVDATATGAATGQAAPRTPVTGAPGVTGARAPKAGDAPGPSGGPRPDAGAPISTSVPSASVTTNMTASAAAMPTAAPSSKPAASGKVVPPPWIEKE